MSSRLTNGTSSSSGSSPTLSRPSRPSVPAPPSRPPHAPQTMVFHTAQSPSGPTNILSAQRYGSMPLSPKEKEKEKDRDKVIMPLDLISFFGLIVMNPVCSYPSPIARHPRAPRTLFSLRYLEQINRKKRKTKREVTRFCINITFSQLY